VLSRSNFAITGTIPVADDQAANRELLTELPTTQGFKFISFADGTKARDQLRRVPTDVVLLEVMMPRMRWQTQLTAELARVLNSKNRSRAAGMRTALIAEDNPVNRELLRQLLEIRGYAVIEASGGQVDTASQRG
jgi:CheY-like chemotaxis protein